MIDETGFPFLFFFFSNLSKFFFTHLILERNKLFGLLSRVSNLPLDLGGINYFTLYTVHFFLVEWVEDCTFISSFSLAAKCEIGVVYRNEFITNEPSRKFSIPLGFGLIYNFQFCL